MLIVEVISIPSGMQPYCCAGGTLVALVALALCVFFRIDLRFFPMFVEGNEYPVFVKWFKCFVKFVDSGSIIVKN